MFLIKNVPTTTRQWPRALVPYKRHLRVGRTPPPATSANDGKLSPQLPEGPPSASSAPQACTSVKPSRTGMVRPGEVTGTWPGNGKVPYGNWEEGNWGSQVRRRGPLHQRPYPRHPHPGNGADDRAAQRRQKRGGCSTTTPESVWRILAESRSASSTPASSRPTRTATPTPASPRQDPGGQPFTFQTLDKNGMVLNMAQTWHQLRPGEVRNDCGGLSRPRQKPTLFNDTAAAKPGYPVFDAVTHTPLLTTKQQDQSSKQWGCQGRDRPAFPKGVKDVDSTATSSRSSNAAASPVTHKRPEKPAGNLVLDDRPVTQ